MKLVAAAVLACATSCSWTWSAQGGYKQPCKRSYAPPILDTIIASVGAGACVAAIIATETSDDEDSAYSIFCYPLMAVTIPAILSAQRGYSGAQTCE